MNTYLTFSEAQMILAKGLSILLTSTFILLPLTIRSQVSDRPILYVNDFEEDDTTIDFEMTDPEAWRLMDMDGNTVLELHSQSQYAPPVRSPINIAIIKDLNVTDFILDVSLKQTGREYGHRDMCVFFGMKDPANYYYVHLASVADVNAHNIFLVNDEDRRNIASHTTNGISWGDGWHHVRIIRKIASATVEVYFDDMDHPIMSASDKHFMSGHVGFGSFDDTGLVDNISVKGVRVAEKTGFFK